MKSNNMQATLRKTLRNILMALIRILLRNGMSYGEFDKIARKCFVDVAFTDFADPKKKQTVSNVAILTGLYRKEVKKLLLAVLVDEELCQRVSLRI